MDERERKYCMALYEIAAVVNAAGTSENVLGNVVERVAKALEAKGCALMLLTPDRKLLLHTADYGLSYRFLQKGPVFADRGIAKALQGQSDVVEDVTVSDQAQYPEKAKEEGIISVLTIPVMLKDEVVGVMRVYAAERRRFTEDDVYFVGAVANLGAIALANVRLTEALKKDYDALRLEIAEWRASLPLIKENKRY